MKFGQLFLRRIVKIVATKIKMSDFKAKMHPISAGAPPQIPLREFTALLETP